ncbi:unnamed protein product [Heterobilharzia americana]|nr:unnamed protein product [Heterobilharzia americana]
MLVSDVPCSFLKELVEEYPKDIKSYEEWFSFLNRMEVRVRSVSSEKPVVTLLRIYECALNCLDADWTNRIYVIIFYRRAVLASHE